MTLPEKSTGYTHPQHALHRAITFISSPAAAAPLYTFELFSSSNGHTAGSLLAATTFNLVTGTGYQDKAFSYSLNAGSYYVINFSRVDNGHLTGLGTKYSWEDPGSFVPYNYGILTMLEGFEGSSPSSPNPLIPHMRLGYGSHAAVPEPASMAVWGLGAIGIAVAHRRRHVAA
ncbi:MAG: PEP-CTERM sorting domain-containing protein [Planctomyces sp.]|nr:PEP-CTERM sorting domain-containing protein [Planctomyces sp.]